MTRLWVLLLLAGGLLADDVRPLGAFARPGIPVLLDGRGEVEAGGWPFLLDGVTPVAVPALPAVVRQGGAELARLEPVPDDVRLVGVAGALPPAVAWEEGVVAVAVRLEGVRPEHWRAFDLFDRVVVTPGAEVPAPAREALETWRAAGGSLVTGDDVVAALAAAGPVAPLRVHRPGNVWPEVYEVAPRPEGTSPAYGSHRLVVWGAAAVFAVQLLLGAAGLIARRVLVGGVLAVALLGGVIGRVRTAADFDPLVEERVVVEYEGARRRVFRVVTAVGPGAALAHDPRWTPLFYRAAGDAWWSRAGGETDVPEGLMRAAVADEPAGPAEAPGAPVDWRADRAVLDLARRAAGPGWEVVGADRPVGTLLRLRLAPQR